MDGALLTRGQNDGVGLEGIITHTKEESKQNERNQLRPGKKETHKSG
jgi:hypothetical protein